MAALFNAVVLLVAIGAIAFEAVQRLLHPQPVQGGVIMAVAAVGIVVNGITAWLFARGRKGDINIRGAFLHMAADAAVSAGVVAAGFLVIRTGWLWLDPATSLVIVAVILMGTWCLLRSLVAMSLDRVPEGIAPAGSLGHGRHERRAGASQGPHRAGTAERLPDGGERRGVRAPGGVDQNQADDGVRFKDHRLRLQAPARDEADRVDQPALVSRQRRRPVCARCSAAA